MIGHVTFHQLAQNSQWLGAIGPSLLLRGAWHQSRAAETTAQTRQTRRAVS